MTKAREAIARALDPAGFDAGYKYKDLCEKRADAAITALRQAGLRIVPEEPDEAMENAGVDSLREEVNIFADEGDAAACYRAMTSAYEDGK